MEKKSNHEDYFVNSAREISCSPDWHWESGVGKSHDFDIWIVLKGKGFMQSCGESYILSPGDAFILRPDKPCIFHHDNLNPLTIIFVHFDYTPNSASLAKLPGFYRKIDDLSFIRRIHLRLVSALEEEEQVESNHWLQVLIYELRRCEKNNKLQSWEQKQKECIESCTLEMSENPSGLPGTGVLARRFGYSKDHFCRIFKKYTGTTPGEYLIRIRMDRAKSLLLFSDFSKGRIAEILEYSDIYYFSKQFRSRTGQSPSQFRL